MSGWGLLGNRGKSGLELRAPHKLSQKPKRGLVLKQKQLGVFSGHLLGEELYGQSAKKGVPLGLQKPWFRDWCYSKNNRQLNCHPRGVVVLTVIDLLSGAYLFPEFLWGFLPPVFLGFFEVGFFAMNFDIFFPVFLVVFVTTDLGAFFLEATTVFVTGFLVEIFFLEANRVIVGILIVMPGVYM